MLWQPSGFPHLYYIHPCQKCQIHFDRNCPGETVCVFAEGFPMIQPGSARLPRARSALAMTNLLALRHRIRAAKPTACKALTERRYRRNRLVRIYRKLVPIVNAVPGGDSPAPTRPFPYPKFSAQALCNVQKFPVHRFLPDFSAQALFRTLSFFHSPMCMAAHWDFRACGTFAHKFCLRTTNTKNYPTYLLR